MTKAISQKTIAVCGIFLLLTIAGCSKDKTKEMYGVSISAPSIAGTPAEVFSEQHIALFRMTNGLSFELLQNTFQHDTSFDNQAYSVLYLLEELCLNDIEPDYMKALTQYCTLPDTTQTQLKTDFISLNQTIHAIDTTLTLSTTVDTSVTDTFKCSTSLLLPLMYEDALIPISDFFSDCNLKKTRRNFYRLSGNFNTLDTEKETAIDVPVGNGNYSLMLIMPKEKQVSDYLKDLSEYKYKNITDKMEIRKTSLMFPSFDDFVTETSLQLPNISADTTIQQQTTLKLRTNIHLLKPTEAVLQTMKKSMEDKMIDAKNEEVICFNKPFIFFLKGSNSGAVLLHGIYRK